MTESLPNAATDAARAGRALGAMFFIVFGGAWLAFWAWRAFERPPGMLAAIAVATVVLLAAAVRRFRRLRPALAATANSAAGRRASRLFNFINAGQWVLILVVGNVLANTGLSAWVIPAVILIIGLHFLPLARLFANPPHYVTGGALIVLAIAYPLIAGGGPDSPVGCLGAGLILWASALWALRS